MKFVRNLESFFERYIEGFFNSKFSSGLQPVEIAKALAKLMEDEKSIGVSQIYVPNHYTVHVSAEDYERLLPYQESIAAELAAYLAEQIQLKNYTLPGKIMIILEKADAVRQGKYQVECRFEQPVGVVAAPAPEVSSETRVFDKVEASFSVKPTALTATLAIVAGPDLGLRFDIGQGRMNIGRRASNEVPLSDLNTSRLQAYITVEEGAHIVHDAKSLNGTYVNDQRIVRKPLHHGDRIRIGNTVLVYEVK